MLALHEDDNPSTILAFADDCSSRAVIPVIHFTHQQVSTPGDRDCSRQAALSQGIRDWAQVQLPILLVPPSTHCYAGPRSQNQRSEGLISWGWKSQDKASHTLPCSAEGAAIDKVQSPAVAGAARVQQQSPTYCCASFSRSAALTGGFRICFRQG